MTHPVLGFARPTGPYGIGTTTYHMVDGDRSEVFASNPDARRELMVQVWYPARTHGSPRAPYLPDARMHADVVRDGLSQPTMFITRDADSMRLERRRAGGWPETDIDETLGTMRSVYERLPSDGYYVQVPGMFHLDMTDAHLLSPLVPWPGLAGPIGAERAHHIVNAYSVAFFDEELRGRRAPLLDGPSDGFPDVLFERRRP